MIAARRRRLFSFWTMISLLTVLLAAVAATWFLATHEKKSYTVHSGESPQARRNPLLAAGLFLREIGHPSESLKGLELLIDLPPAGDAIVIRRLPRGMSEKLTDDLLLWVSGGGHLLVVPNPLTRAYAGHTSLLRRMGAGFMEQQSDCGCPPKDADAPGTATTDSNTGDKKPQQTAASGDSATPQPEDTEEGDPQGPSHALLQPVIDGHAIELETFRPRLLKDLSDQAVFSLKGSYAIDYELEADRNRSDQDAVRKRQGAWLLQYTLGQGRVTFLSEMNLFYNERIGDYDHAFFLSWLTRGDEKVWLIYSTAVESILTIVWKLAPHFWTALGATIILLLWRLQLRSGTQRREESTGSRDVLDHIDATAHYGWRTERLSTVFAANRKALLALWGRKTMGTVTARPEADSDLALLAERCNLPPGHVRSAFQSTADTEETLISTSRTLQRIRQLITAGVKGKP